jgi:hypothetical protein
MIDKYFSLPIDVDDLQLWPYDGFSSPADELDLDDQDAAQ